MLSSLFEAESHPHFAVYSTTSHEYRSFKVQPVLVYCNETDVSNTRSGQEHSFTLKER